MPPWGTLKARFIYPDELAECSKDLQEYLPKPVDAAARRASENLALPVAATNLAVSLVGKAVESIVDAAALLMQAEVTTLDATVPVEGFFGSSGDIAVRGGYLLFHNSNNDDPAQGTLAMSLELIASPDRSAFGFRVQHWQFRKFLASGNLFQQSKSRDVVLRIEFLSPSSSELGIRAVFIERVLTGVGVLQVASAFKKDDRLPWCACPPNAAQTQVVRYAPMNIRITVVETTRPRKIAEWLQQEARSRKASIVSGVQEAARHALDAVHASAQQASHAEAASAAYSGYKAAWDDACAYVQKKPASGPELSVWKAGKEAYAQALAAKRSVAKAAFASASLDWPGDLPDIDPPQPINASETGGHAMSTKPNANPQWCFAWFQAPAPTTSIEKAALVKSSRWPSGSNIRIGFMDGTDAQKALVMKFAEGWIVPGLANLTFSWEAPENADVRISFRYSGSWSVIGNTCKSVPKNQPTMNFGWLTPDVGEEEARRVVLHEFGHALGLIHEHQNPIGAIEWNKQAVYHDLSGPPNNWDRETIDHNMFETYDKQEIDGTQIDGASIMMYPIPATWVTDPAQATGLNQDLSATDKKFIKKAYP